MTVELRPRGPCAFCGGPDSRHREVDAVVERIFAGDSIEDTAEDFDWSVPMVRAAAVAAISERFGHVREGSKRYVEMMEAWQNIMEDTA